MGVPGKLTSVNIQQAVLDEFLSGGVSVRELAKRHGIGRETVNNILGRGHVVTRRLPPQRDPDDPVRVPDHRCGGCGYKVKLEPCQICRAMRK